MTEDRERFEVHLPVEAAGKAAELLSAAANLSRARVKQVMQRGAVWRTRGGTTRRLRRGGAEVGAGETLHLYYDARVLASEPPPARLVADEGDYSVWFKPSGMRSQGSKWGDHCTLERWSAKHLAPERSVFTVHRLDRAARGLMLLAHSKTAAAAFARLFRERAVEKRYRALVLGAFPEALTLTADVDGKPAASRARRLEHDPARDRSWVEVEIETGRKHQIRRHLAGAGHPIVGDRLYGGGDEEDLQLEACLLAFTCPLTQAPRRYTATGG